MQPCLVCTTELSLLRSLVSTPRCGKEKPCKSRRLGSQRSYKFVHLGEFGYFGGMFSSSRGTGEHVTLRYLLVQEASSFGCHTGRLWLAGYKASNLALCYSLSYYQCLLQGQGYI